MKNIFSVLIVLLSVTAPAQELKKQILREGAGPEARPFDELIITYSIWQTEGKNERLIEKQDSDTRITMDDKKLLPGIFQGLLGSKKGQRVNLILPPELAYGKKSEGSIEPNATLKFEIDVKDLKPRP